MSMEKVKLPGNRAAYIPACKVCDNPGRARLIEADWAAGRSMVVIAKDMTENGWPITDRTIRRHLSHVPGAHNRTNEPLPTLAPKRDGVDFVKGRLLDAILAKERRLLKQAEDEGIPFDGEFMLDKDLQPALNTVLKAEGIKIKREEAASKRQIGLFMLMLGKTGGLAPEHLLGDGSIEGEAKDVTPKTGLEAIAEAVNKPDYPETYARDRAAGREQMGDRYAPWLDSEWDEEDEDEREDGAAAE